MKPSRIGIMPLSTRDDANNRLGGRFFLLGPWSPKSRSSVPGSLLLESSGSSRVPASILAMGGGRL